MSMTIRVLVVLVGVVVVLLAAAWLKLRGPDIPYETLESRYAGRGSGFADLGGGLRVHYEVDGDASAPPLVLVHGFGDSFTSWEGWVAALADRYRVIRIDLPGHGLTRAPDGYQATGPGYVAVVEGVATSLGLPHFAIAGNSMGGAVAWQYAQDHPERLSALILVDAAGWPMPLSGDLPIAFRILQYSAGRWLLARIDNRPLIEEGLKRDVRNPAVITTPFIDRWAEFQRAPGHRAILVSTAPTSFATATEVALASIAIPTLVLHGEEDTLIAVGNGRRFAAAIPKATLITYPNVGHLPQVEIPGQSAADVAAFLGRLAPAR